MSGAPTALADFIHRMDHIGLPDDVRHQIRRCLLDLVSVAAAETTTPLPQILRDHVHRHTPGRTDSPRLLLDGRRVRVVES